MAKSTTLAAKVLDTTLEEVHMEVPATRRLTVTERSTDMEDRRIRRALESSRPESSRLASTQRSVRARSTSCLTVHTLGRTKLLPCCPSTSKKRDADKKKANFKTLGNNRATTENRDGQIAYLTAENLEVKITVLTDTGSDCSAILRSAVEDARKRGFPLKVEVLPESIVVNMAIKGESDRQTCSATEMLMSAVTITTPSGPLCMRGVRQIIVEEDMDHPLVGRPVLDEMGFVASQHLDSVQDKFHLHDFSHIGEELLDMGKQPLSALAKLLLMPADIPEFIEDFPDVLTLAKKKKHEASGASEAARA
jgi:hypothetical protein